MRNPVQQYVQRLAQERSISVAEARRVLKEQIDHRKRQKVSDGKIARDRGVSVKTENPQRVHVQIHDQELHPPSEAVISAGRTKGRPRKFPDLPPLPRISLTDPAPGTLSAIIVGELKDPEKDFKQVYNSLRAMDRFNHLDNKRLGQRIREVAWRYQIEL